MAGVLEGVNRRTQLAGHNRLELLLFRLKGKLLFGINVFKVQEVIQCPPLTQVPGAHPVVKGVANLRGRTITVMDLSMAIGGPVLGDPKDFFIIVTEYNRRIQGFLVGSVDRIVNINWKNVLPPPRGIAGESYMTAVTQVDDQLVEVIDVEKVLKEIMGEADSLNEEAIDQDIQATHHNVLLVDDSSVARNQVKRVLDRLGVKTTLCNDGRQAFDLLTSMAEKGEDVAKHFSMVISDVEMPQMDGYTLTTEIRRNQALADLHIILHTSLSGVFNESMIEKVGADEFLAKYEPDALAAIVQAQIKAHDSTQMAGL